MKTFRFGLMLLMLLTCAGYATAQSKGAASENGSIIEQVPKLFNDLPAYEQRVEITKKRLAADDSLKTPEAREEALKVWQISFPKQDYEELKTQTQIEILKIKYMSDGLKISGYIFKPKVTDGKKYPVVIYNHGGNRNPLILIEFLHCYKRLAKQGFIVLASEYRGNGDSEGKEEFGGADVNDVMNLIPLAKSLPYADTQNIFMYGFSRGSIMTYEAMRNKIAINAAAIDSGVTDLEAQGKLRPEMVQYVYRELMPDFDKRAAEHYRLRSAILFAEQINTPILIIHGTVDWRVQATDALKFAERLQELKKTYELVIYAGDGHGVPLNQEDSWNRIVKWFKKHMK